MGVKTTTFMDKTVYQCTECGAEYDSSSEAWECCEGEEESAHDACFGTLSGWTDGY